MTRELFRFNHVPVIVQIKRVYRVDRPYHERHWENRYTVLYGKRKVTEFYCNSERSEEYAQYLDAALERVLKPKRRRAPSKRWAS